jgi:hypothetical protein
VCVCVWWPTADWCHGALPTSPTQDLCNGHYPVALLLCGLPAVECCRNLALVFLTLSLNNNRPHNFNIAIFSRLS